MKGPGDFSPPEDDDRIDRRAESLAREIENDADRMAEFYADEADDLDSANLARLLHKLHGTEPDKLVGSDVLADLYRVARDLAAGVERRVLEAAQEQAEIESRDWPAWRGSIEATRAHAQRNAHRYED